MRLIEKRATEAYCSASLFDQGIGHVTVARFKLNGEAEIGVFLVDAFCLGVKDAFFTYHFIVLEGSQGSLSIPAARVVPRPPPEEV